jgi:hypothetical protein
VGVLEEGGVRALFRDLQRSAQVSAVRTKRGLRGRAGDTVSLEDGVRALLEGDVSGLQILYRFDGQEWCDTLLSDGLGAFRLVRRGEP